MVTYQRQCQLCSSIQEKYSAVLYPSKQLISMRKPAMILERLRLSLRKLRRQKCHRWCRLISHNHKWHDTCFDNVSDSEEAYPHDPCFEEWHPVCLWNWLHERNTAGKACKVCVYIFQRLALEYADGDKAGGTVFCRRCGRPYCLGPCRLPCWRTELVEYCRRAIPAKLKPVRFVHNEREVSLSQQLIRQCAREALEDATVQAV